MAHLTPSLPRGLRGPVFEVVPVAPKGCPLFENLSLLILILIISATAEERDGNLPAELSFGFSRDVDFYLQEPRFLPVWTNTVEITPLL